MAKNLQDTDLFLVNRGVDSYKTTFADLKDSLTSPLVINEIYIKDATGNIVNPASNPPTLSTGTQLTAEPQVSGGDAPYNNAFQWQRDAVDISNAITSVYTTSAADVGKVLTCVVVSSDSADPQNTATKTSNATGVVEIEPPDTPTLLSPVNGSNVDGNNFTMLASGFVPSTQSFQSTTFQVSATSDFSTTVVNETVSSTSLTVRGKIDSGAMSYDTTYYARCLQTNTDNVSSAYSAVNTFTTTEEPPTPTTIDLSGLRFDNDRQAYMFTTTPGGSSVTWTFSTWIKLTEYPDTTAYIFAGGPNLENGLRVQPDGKLLMTTGTGGDTTGTSGAVTVPLDEWVNLVVSSDNGVITFSVNAKSETNPPVTFNYFNQGQGSWISTSSSGYGINGYLSDTYFVNNQHLSPYTFGKRIGNGTWVPQKNTDIKAEINAGPISTYDERPNTSQEWSTLATGNEWNSTYPLINIFDGQIDTEGGLENVEDATGTLNFTGLGTVDKLEIYGSLSGQDSAGGPIAGGIVINDVDITAGGSASIWSKGGGQNDKGWVTISGSDIGNTLTSIKMTIKQPCSPYFNMIKVNGRPIVDQGTFDASQNWSSLPVTGTVDPNYPLTNVFNGTIGPSYLEGSRPTSGFLTMDFSSLNMTVGTVKVYYTQAGTADIKINGTSIGQSPGTNVSSTFTVNGILQNISWQYANGTNYIYMLGIEVTNQGLLVDAGYQYNTSNTWSNMFEGQISASAAIANTFDGNTETSNLIAASNGDQTITYTLTGLTDGASVKIKTTQQSASASINCNGTVIETYTGDQIITDCGTLSGTTLTIIQSIGTSQPSDGSRIFYVEVGGQLLVDPGFGPSGFYLPFDPETARADYSAGITSPNTDLASNDAFNGVGGLTKTVPSNNGEQRIIWTPPADTTGSFFSFVTDGEASISTGSPTYVEVTAGGSTYTYNYPTTGGGTSVSIKVDFPEGAITQVEWKKPAGTGGTLGFKQPTINGALLVNHESIGGDSSGNNNDFTTNNFGAGITKLWSSLTTADGGFGTDYPAAMMYNGYVTDDNRAQTAQGGKSILLTIPEGVRVNSSIGIWSGKSSVTYQINNETQVTYSDAVSLWKIIPFSGVLGRLEIWHGSGGSQTSGVSGLMIDGRLLIDTPFQDSVIDTPVSDYAVFTAPNTSRLGNGNLVYNNPSSSQWRRAGSTITTPPEEIIYAEVIPDAISLQQRYSVGLFTNVSQTNEIGSESQDYGYFDDGNKKHANDSSPYGASFGVGDVIGMVYDAKYRTPGGPVSPFSLRANTSQEWDSQQQINGGGVVADKGMDKAFNGILSNGCEPANGGSVEVTLPPAPYTGFWRLNVTAGINDGQPSGYFGLTLNGNEDITNLLPNNTTAWITVGEREVGSISWGTADAAAGTFVVVNAVELDGQLLVKESLWNQSQEFSSQVEGPSQGYANGNPPSLGFDGNPATIANAASGGGVMYFTPKLGAGPFAVEVKFGNDQLYTQTTIDGNAPDRTGSGSTVGYWDSVSFDQLIMDSTGLNNSARCCWNYIKVDGKYLVDSGYIYDTSAKWSEGITSGNAPFANAGSKADMFDGITPFTSDDWSHWYASGYQSNNQPITYTFATEYPVTTSFEAYLYKSSGPWSCKINGQSCDVSVGNVDNIGYWATVTLPLGAQAISSFELNGEGDSGSGNGCAAIRIDGKVLVDPNKPVGSLTFYKNGNTNGPAYTDIPADDYLLGIGVLLDTGGPINYGQQPFQYATNNNDGTATIPAPLSPYETAPNTTKVWSNSVSSGSSFQSGQGPAFGFDGTQANACVLADNDGADEGTIVITFSPALSGSVEIAINSGRNVGVNGGPKTKTYGTASASGPLFQLGSYETVSSIEIESGGSGYPAAFSMIKVGGRELVDSGLWNNSQNWSSGATETSPTYGSWQALFDGTAKSNSEYLQSPTSATTRCNWTGINSTQVELSGFANSASAELLVHHAGGSFNCASLMPTATNDQTYVTIPSSNFTAPITGISLTSTAADNNCGLYGVKIGGALLVDAGAQWNTDETWSNRCIIYSTDGGVQPNTSPIYKMFDGDITNSYSLTTSNGKNARCTFDPPITGSTVRVYVDPAGTATNKTANGTTSLSGGWNNIPGGTLNYLQATSQPATGVFNVSAIEVDGKILVNGAITAKLLVNDISEQVGVGTLFYDENKGGVTTLLSLMNRYGFTGAKPGCGIYELTEQPTFDVANYIKSGDYYVPTRTYSRLFKCLLKAVSVDWAATTAFTKDQIVEYNDLFYCVTADHTTGSSFVSDNLHIIETAEAFTTAFAPAGLTDGY